MGGHTEGMAPLGTATRGTGGGLQGHLLPTARFPHGRKAWIPGGFVRNKLNLLWRSLSPHPSSTGLS